ncbi:M48 family metallopeptidase [Paludisphaera borealis]|uniref:Protease HtpX n=1 Tax=Paludisphaera borealis TaxID=1387353 RepID=A0A1U7CTU4_9BACT|nr:M48 family metallopeptidase [Paludisphaera borealis]APW62328.1 Protease HtpX [Paludisphaera borealis]
MGRAQAGVSRELQCPDCAAGLEPVDSVVDADEPSRFTCPLCRGVFRVERVRPEPSRKPGPSHLAPPLAPSPVGSLKLVWRALVLWILEKLFWSVNLVGAIVFLLLGGFVPVLGGWLRNEVESWADVVETLGGVWFRSETNDPDADLGPVLARVDAPLLFAAIDVVSRRLGVKPPGQVRLTYLPCCGVVAWRRSQALLIGLPLLRVLTQAELRAILAHELAHLACGDATRAARLARFVQGLELAVEHRADRLYGPLGAWARYCLHEASWLIEPVAWGQEARADRLAALIAGGGAAASALVKVAMVQPLFREVLEYYDPVSAETNLYAFFRIFWFRLPAEIRSAMRMRILTTNTGGRDPAHPPLPDRLALLQSYPDHVSTNGDGQPANTFLGDLEIFEQMLHNRLFAINSVEPSVFHRACS